jgi:hypothetical protein
MDALPPNGGASGSGSGGSGAPGKQGAAAAQPVIELFGSDMYTAGVTLLLLLLGLMHAAMVPAACRC